MQSSYGRQQGTSKDKPFAVVTGASSGFGLLITLALAKDGYRVAAVLRDLSRGDALRESLQKEGLSGEADLLEADVTDEAAVRRVIQETIGRYGRIDLLVNNAGFALGGFVEEVPMEEWRRIMETNFFALVSMTREVLPIMRAQRSGCIVNMSSISGRVGFPAYAPYAASKFAVEGFSESLRLEMQPYGVNVVLLEPGAYRTEIWNKGFAAIQRSPDSAYEPSLDAVLRYSQRSAAQAPDPREVAEAVVRIARDMRPALRYPLGRGTRLTLAAKALLPWRRFERLVQRLLR
ncbi:SDR family oxidoreductase [Paenibacillus sp. GD4]|uniref:SDR family oxidoreductase n=1 Tax=Paenibacillus sp. GD4 TaxID=3068890 RepID=UPI002796B410|nr:SDR family oxidoreductase [Paenibacillus sp. GD4]MDQ1910428.1 SDR family oxidoreductase [Paenibacillus sp. GD4]